MAPTEGRVARPERRWDCLRGTWHSTQHHNVTVDTVHKTTDRQYQPTDDDWSTTATHTHSCPASRHLQTAPAAPTIDHSLSLSMYQYTGSVSLYHPRMYLLDTVLASPRMWINIIWPPLAANKDGQPPGSTRLVQLTTMATLPEVKGLRQLFKVLTQYRHVTDGRTDTDRRQQNRAVHTWMNADTR